MKKNWQAWLTGVLAAASVVMGGVLAYGKLADDCCNPGGSCCKAGAPCCAGHAHKD